MGRKLETFIDLFAGIGGFRIALESYGLDCVFSSEWDKYAQLTYLKNFGETPAGDITKIEATEIPPHDILCAGFPCQAFSISGKQKGFEDTRGTLFFDIARIINHHKPKVLLLENVKNFERHDHGNTLKTVKKVLDDLEYHVYHKVLNASEYGAPTARKRIYFVCFRKDLNIPKKGITGNPIFEFPEPTKEKIYLKDLIDYNADTSEVEIKRNDIKMKKDPKQKPALKPIQIGIINGGGQGERIYSIDGHAITLSAYGGGAGAKTGAYSINGKIRKLTPKECARIMGFPENFKLPVSLTQAHKQFGNSVVVPVLKKIVEQIQNTTQEKKLCLQKN